MAESEDCIGIVYGSGNYPKLVVQACLEKKIDCCIAFVVEDFDFEPSYSEIPVLRAKIGKIGSIIKFFRNNGVKKIIFAGAVKRPNFTDLSLDSKGASWLLKLGRSIFGGDDALLRAIANLLNKEGFEIMSGTDLLGNVFVKNGVFSQKNPTESEWQDIAKGFKVAKTIGSLDIGQSIIVCCGDILGIECVEGTDELIKRCAKLRKQNSGGILVKTSKPQQDQRMDLPTVGVNTVYLLHQFKFSGLAVESGHCIVLDSDKLIELSDNYSMFFAGISEEMFSDEILNSKEN